MNTNNPKDTKHVNLLTELTNLKHEIINAENELEAYAIAVVGLNKIIKEVEKL